MAGRNGAAGAQGRPPKSLGKALLALLYGLLLICPVCHRGRMGRTLFDIRHHCPVCGVVFERDPGEVTGGMAINMVLSSLLGVALAIYGALFSRLSLGVMVTLLVAVTLAFGLLFHRHARGLWVGFLYATGAIAER